MFRFVSVSLHGYGGENGLAPAGVFCYTCPALTTLPQDKRTRLKQLTGSPKMGWALLLLALLTAVLFRFYGLGELPPGLYRDEAFNGLDAQAVLNGELALFFPANNGREPLYIYLTTLFVGLFGPSTLAVRLGAAVTGVVTTLLVYLLAREWFTQRIGLLSAWLWAVTLWAVHLSRIGFRPILLTPFLTLAFWLGTLAYRRGGRWLWLLAGLAYGVTFYTYLASRFTPLLLAVIAATLLLLRRRAAWKRLWPDGLWFLLGTAVVLLPFALLTSQQPEIILGRTGQVSILNPDINGGDLWGTLTQQALAALGMFIRQGDTILRHNPAGRPVFDILMVIPFLLGVLYCIRHWRQMPALTLLLWVLVMLGPTILAEDTPHFLRASGVLPAVVILPAIGLSQIWDWRPDWSRLVVILLLIASLAITAYDYINYGRDPETAYLFEDAARTLAERVNDEGLGTAVFIDERFWSGWPSIPFLVTNQAVDRFFA